MCVTEASYLPTHFVLQVDTAPLAAKFDSSDGAHREDKVVQNFSVFSPSNFLHDFRSFHYFA